MPHTADNAKATATKQSPGNAVDGRWIGYDRMAEHLWPAAMLVAERARHYPGSWIDIGSGSGNVLRAAKTIGRAPIGIDTSVEQLRSARNHFQAANGPVQLQGDAQSLPIRSKTITFATSNFGLIFAANITLALTEIARCLAPQGTLLFTTWTPGGWPDAARSILADHAGTKSPPFATALGRPEVLQHAFDEVGFIARSTKTLSLRWKFSDLDDAVETLTTAAGGLRRMRQQLEAQDHWDGARQDLRHEFSKRCTPADQGLILDDEYLLVEAQCSNT